MSNKTPGFGDLANPFGEIDADVEQYVPPAGGATLASWERQEPAPQPAQATSVIEDDEPFTAAHLAAASQTVVPAINPQGGNTAAPSIAFTASVAPSGDLSGRIGGAPVPSIPRLGSAPDNTRLLGSNATSSAPVSGGGGAGSSPADLPVEDPSSYPFYSIKRYRTYFNVDTDEVLNRIFRAVAFFFKGDFLDHVGSNPDLYGPFWIASTLVFVSAAAGNTASYIAYRKATGGGGGGAVPPSSPDTPDPSTHSSGWYYDVDKVGGSMGLFYGYVGVVGMLLWAVLRWGFKAGVGLAQVWCCYGYALAAYIPMAALCVLPMEAVRWSLVGAATAVSGVFLMLNFRSMIVDAAGAKAVPLLLVMLGIHGALGLALKLYFFHYSV